jgi:hypothetical protein
MRIKKLFNQFSRAFHMLGFEEIWILARQNTFKL